MTSYSSPNFGFLAMHDDLLVEYAVRAEHYVFSDPNAALLKLRQFIETLSSLAAAESGIRRMPNATLADTLRALRQADVIDERLAGLFRSVQQRGNRAAHDHLASQKAALDALKAARICAVWFHRAFGNDAGFKAGAFVPPKQPIDASAMLRRELEALRMELAESKRAAEVATESAEQAAAREAAALDAIERAHADVEAAFALAAETEAQLEAQRAALSARLAERTEQVATSSDLQADAQKRGRDAALDMELTEAETRLVIDAQIRAAGWDADSVQLRFSAGVRPQVGRSVAIAEWPTASGPAD